MRSSLFEPALTAAAGITCAFPIGKAQSYVAQLLLEVWLQRHAPRYSS